ncbi:citrate synthase [Halalkaliarchaeum desulfuricum]|uniref:Citrate synthase n=1 Tax=Halalkaliarchaeum desulfuricum TaxID=2055893 RepID=A0A343TGY0_9EURY|nr:citrate synthase [Halalkaliarchaeum desulfuricum]AUX08352.1 citrate synthase [Halalkaliarchaeum desulfuricum]
MVELLQEITRPELNRGLEGVVVDSSSLSDIDGDAGRLIYRGYEIEDLATGASFEEVLHLLWHGELPDRDELEAFVEPMAQERPVGDGVLELMAELARQDEDPMAALRTGVSMLSAYDPEPDAEPEDMAAMARDGRRITAKIPTVLAAFDRYRRGEEPIEPRADLGHAENFLYMLTGEEPDEIAAETFDMALTLHADHGLNASTFTTMVIVSTYADVYNAVTGGIGALAGHWHGGANQDVMYTLMDLDESGLDPIEWVEQTLEEGGRIPGWGHRVYNVKDPRAKILEERSALLAESTGETKWHDYTTAVERYLTDEIGLPEKNIAPNVDFYSGSVYYQLGIPIDLYTPIFAMSRVGGWMAHILEYVEDNRLIRPRARYVGPTSQEFVPLEER